MNEPYQQSPAWRKHRMRVRDIGKHLTRESNDIDAMPPEVARWAIEQLKPIAEVRTERDQQKLFDGTAVTA